MGQALFGVVVGCSQFFQPSCLYRIEKHLGRLAKLIKYNSFTSLNKLVGHLQDQEKNTHANMETKSTLWGEHY